MYVATIKDGENAVEYNKSRTESGKFNITGLKGFARYTLKIEAVNNRNERSSSEREFTSAELCKFLY